MTMKTKHFYRNKFSEIFILLLMCVCSFLILLLSFGLSACEFTPNKDDNGYEESNLSTFEMPNVMKYDLVVDKLHPSRFSLPVIVNVDLNKYKTNTATINKDIYVVGCEGTELNDLTITGEYVSCVTTEDVKVDDVYKYYACIFDFTVSAKSTWSAKEALRKISSIKVSILDKEVDVPVDINIKEKSKATFINECPVILNSDFLTLTTSSDLECSLAINWNIEGWGAIEWTDPNYATITGFYFENNTIKLKDMKVIQPKYEGDDYQEKETVINLNNCEYKLETYDCARAGSWLEFSVEKEGAISSEINCLADSLIMQYTLNNGIDVYEVCLANVQLYNYEDVLRNFYEDNIA